MPPSDYAVVVYKLLSYLYECVKGGVAPNIDKAREMLKVGDAYFDSVVSCLISKF